MIDVYIELFNIIFETGIIADSSLVGYIKPIYKNKRDKLDPKNFRPITILCCVSKLFTTILNERLNKFRMFFDIMREPNGLVAKQIALGYSKACAIQLDDTFECWYGAFGRVRSSKSSVKVKQIAVGYNNTCAIKLDGSVQCWKIFDDKDESMLDMPNGLIAKKIAVGNTHACAIRLNNTVVCWGKNYNGQAEPPEGLMAKEIVAGGSHSCALKLNNTVECWGSILNPPSGLIAKKL
jgi:hypothetical protein